MKKLIRKRTLCICPYCLAPNNIKKDGQKTKDICEHLYEVIKENNGYYFYFIKSGK